MINEGMMASSRDDWETPTALFELLDAQFHFYIDVCADEHNAKCKNYITKETDALSVPWPITAMGTCWMNPPYGRTIIHWVQKAAEEAARGATIVALLPARTDTEWFHSWVAGYAEITFLKGRLKFSGCKHAAPFPSMIAVYRPPYYIAGWRARRNT